MSLHLRHLFMSAMGMDVRWMHARICIKFASLCVSAITLNNLIQSHLLHCGTHFLSQQITYSRTQLLPKVTMLLVSSLAKICLAQRRNLTANMRFRILSSTSAVDCLLPLVYVARETCRRVSSSPRKLDL